MPMWLLDTAIVLIPVVLAGVAKLIMDISSLRSEVDDLKTNHLAHIYARLQSIDEYLRKQF